MIFACTLFLAGCGSEQTAPLQQEDEDNHHSSKQVEVGVDKKAPSEEADIEEKTPSQQQDEDTEPFELVTDTYEDGKLTILYPQLYKMQDKDIEQQINTLIKEDVLLFFKQYQDGDSPLEMAYEVILPQSDTFSIQYTGDYNGGMYPTSLFFTTTIDWKKGEKVRFSDLYVIDDALIEKLKHATYVDWGNPKEPNQEKHAAIVEYLNTIEPQTLIEAIKQADHPNPVENPYGVFSYYLDDAVIISIQVPHALGDHAEFKLNRNNLVKK